MPTVLGEGQGRHAVTYIQGLSGFFYFYVWLNSKAETIPRNWEWV